MNHQMSATRCVTRNTPGLGSAGFPWKGTMRDAARNSSRRTRSCGEVCSGERNNMKLRKWHDADKKRRMELVRPDIDRIIRESGLPISDDKAWRILLTKSSSRKLKTRMELQTRKKMYTQCGKIFSTSAKVNLHAAPNAPVKKRPRREAEKGKMCTQCYNCLLYTSPSPRDRTRSRMPSSA